MNKIKKVGRIIFQVIILYLFSTLGSFVVELLPFSFPGSIAGLLILLACLLLKILPANLIKDGAGFLLAFLALFFVPATAGIMDYPQLASLKGVFIIIALIISTMFTIVVAGKVCQYFESKIVGEDLK
ncbi:MULTISPECIES: CidA/LrgA family protein [unclassified Psychrobacillus]|uniref:CidA/LrgA family protein n=1 Tax=unclassified Psychrobacillus TaxID=2636677 RepID=UPI00146DD16E|nr:CidA/LrgA family protein [Psychrobacillus sp. BL-248-WT-3]NME05179.1 CidA/LrgA family protein [Psychrobacillus sp. BL-248-WT-3]